MRTAFTVRIPNHLHKRLKLRSVELDLSMQDCIDQAIERWLGLHSAVSHGDDCPLARAPRDQALILEALLQKLQEGGELAEFLAGGFKWLVRRRVE